MTRALVISDAHLGTVRGRAMLSEPIFLAALEAKLAEVDELVLLGDIFELLSAKLSAVRAASAPLFDMVRHACRGKRVVFVPGNHDHPVLLRRPGVRTVWTQQRQVAALRIAGRVLRRGLSGVDTEVHYPAYWYGGVLCTHGHFLNVQARANGIDLHNKGVDLLADWLLDLERRRVLGGDIAPRTEADYDAVLSRLTVAASAGLWLPQLMTARSHLLAAVRRVGRPRSGERSPVGRTALAYALDGPAPQGWDNALAPAGVLARDDPREPALRAFDLVVRGLGWAGQDATDVVFAHTHRPLAGAQVEGSPVRYWNTGSWLYLPPSNDPASAEFDRYVRDAWPGTAVLVDSDAPHPQLLSVYAGREART